MGLDPMTLAAIQAVGTGVSMLGAQSSASYQAAVATRMAEQNEANAERARTVGQIQQQEQDFEAAGILAGEVAKQAASGFEVSSTGFARRNKLARTLARRDALRIREDAEIEAENFETAAQDNRTQAAGAKMRGRAALLSGFLQFGADYVSGANMARADKVRALEHKALVKELKNG